MSYTEDDPDIKGQSHSDTTGLLLSYTEDDPNIKGQSHSDSTCLLLSYTEDDLTLKVKVILIVQVCYCLILMMI